MKQVKLISTLIFLFCLSPAQAKNMKASANNESVIKARNASKELLTNLKTQLTSALKNGSTESAILTCSAIAPHIASDVSVKYGLKIKRVSLNNRNPMGKPDDFEKDALKYFDFLNRENMLKPNHEYFSVVKEHNQNYFRYLKPIITTKMCLQCHSYTEKLKPEVLKIIREKYPDDTATGYNEGDVRGAVSVRIKLK